jgi:hypothetical protein
MVLSSPFRFLPTDCDCDWSRGEGQLLWYATYSQTSMIGLSSISGGTTCIKDFMCKFFKVMRPQK